ncbi:hypothetical protein LEP1GSC062_4210 [Leptospira alexanderi serovar Manhao 3 str. L 60]|uniref:Uncharacterized protein n=1 Tax=Leptospira alexanderi serovar Manhao 3 str. L 60 TaxID=1049759 RepID=V6IEV5_9LEPT|nr:hypothetical protein LEP1GSC062_4210 [Leptospira alexanderi serovar Manhao 3 str. L 60]
MPGILRLNAGFVLKLTVFHFIGISKTYLKNTLSLFKTPIPIIFRYF